MKIITNTAISLDGKIATSYGSIPFLGSDTDKKRLREIRNQSDAILVGGNSFRNWPKPSLPADETKSGLYNVIVTRSMDLPFRDEFLAEKRVRSLVLTDRVGVDPDYPVEVAINENGVSAQWIVEELEKRGVQTLLIEGGGEIIFLFFEAGLINEMYVTLCPKIVGGREAPSLVSGTGFDAEQIQNLTLLDSQISGDEIFLHYGVQKQT